MKNYNEMANDVLRRIKENEAIKAKKKNMYMRYAVSFATMVVISVAGFNIWHIANPPISNDIENSELDNTHTDDVDNQEQLNDILTDKDVIWADSDNMEMQLAVIEWNGKNIAWTLHDAFEKCEENSLFAITAVRMCVDKEYIYNGKSLGEYEAAMLKDLELIGKLECLIKEGDHLKYGEALYLTGAPDGEKWAKELYDKTVSWYGEEVLNKYIQNGEFLKEKLNNDLQTFLKRESQLEYEEAMRAYIDSANRKLKEELEEQDIVSEFSPDVDYLLIYATEAEIEKLEIENQLDWLFELAVKGVDGAKDLDDVEE